jgi:hypothetical protein
MNAPQTAVIPSIHPYLLRLVPLAALMLAAMGCGGERLTGRELHDAYQEALVDTEDQARADWDNDSEALAAAIGRLQTYYEEVTVERVASLTRQVYAEQAYLCDTLHVARGAAAIEAYFRQTAERVTRMGVTILDYSTTGREVYTRWSMTIAAEELADGEPMTTYGMSHFRFDRDGKVILHQDFWDASAGFFEHLPGLATVIPRIRGSLEE